MKLPFHRRAGHAVVEAALALPAFTFCFMAAFDLGFYCWALIATQGAARSIAVYSAGAYAAGTQPTQACSYALAALRHAPNVGASVTSCSALPVLVAVQPLNDAYGNPSARATVSYRTVALLPIPGLLSGQWTITRTVQMRI